MPLRNGTRMLGRTVYDSGTSERPLDTYSQVDRSMDRMQFGAKVDFENDWVLDMSYTRSVFNQQRTELQDTQSVEFELAINGMGGPNCILSTVQEVVVTQPMRRPAVTSAPVTVTTSTPLVTRTLIQMAPDRRILTLVTS